MSAELSGRVDVLEASMVQAQQDLLVRPDLNTYNNLQQNWQQQLDNFEAALTAAVNTQRTLTNIYSNLAYELRQISLRLTGHTGQILYGTDPAHGGIPP